MHVYCLFCQTYRCSAIARFIEAVMHYRVIMPHIVQRKWVKGVAFREEHDYLPGYLFLYTEEPVEDHQPILQIDGVIRCLGYVDNNGAFCFAELTGNDLTFARMLYACDGLIDNVKVYREGDLLKPAAGLLADMEGRILKVDHHRERLLMAFCFEGIERQVWVGFDVVEAKPAANEQERSAQ